MKQYPVIRPSETIAIVVYGKRVGDAIIIKINQQVCCHDVERHRFGGVKLKLIANTDSGNVRTGFTRWVGFGVKPDAKFCHFRILDEPVHSTSGAVFVMFTHTIIH